MSTTTNVSNLKINFLTSNQYATITPSATELYFITDESELIRNIGEVVTSTIPLTDAGLHLLDGALISGSGSYSAFVDYIADLVTDYPDLFCTETEWQDSISAYGVCGKFVYDSTNNTVRLPKRSSPERYLIQSHSSGTSWYRIYSDGWCEQGGVYDNGSNARTVAGTVTFSKTFINTDYSIVITGVRDESTGNCSGAIGARDKATSNIWIAFYGAGSSDYARYIYWRACGYTDISGYLMSELYEYIVLATSAKTDIQVDIDEIATDLNGKADVDLSNINASCKSIDGQWVQSNYTVVETSGTINGTQYDLSSYLPNDNYKYLVKFRLFGYDDDGNYGYYVNTDIFDSGYTSTNVNRRWTQMYGGVYSRQNCVVIDLPVGASRYINVYGSGADEFCLYALGYRRIGTNS